MVSQPVRGMVQGIHTAGSEAERGGPAGGNQFPEESPGKSSQVSYLDK